VAALCAWNNLPSPCRHFAEFIPVTFSNANSKHIFAQAFEVLKLLLFIFNCILVGAIAVLAHLRRLNLDFVD